MKCGPGRCRIGQHLLHVADRADVGVAAHVDEDRDSSPGGELEDPQDLQAGRARGVDDAEAEPQPALAQPLVEQREQPFLLFGCRLRLGGAPLGGQGGSVGGLRRHVPHQLVFEQRDARRRMADADPEVHDRLAPALLGQGRDREGAHLEIELHRHAVERLEACADLVLAVGVQVDEAGGHDQALDVDGLGALE